MNTNTSTPATRSEIIDLAIQLIDVATERGRYLALNCEVPEELGNAINQILDSFQNIFPPS